MAIDLHGIRASSIRLVALSYLEQLASADGSFALLLPWTMKSGLVDSQLGAFLRTSSVVPSSRQRLNGIGGEAGHRLDLVPQPGAAFIVISAE